MWVKVSLLSGDEKRSLFGAWNGWDMLIVCVVSRYTIYMEYTYEQHAVHPYTLPTDIARLIKGRSSHDLREEFPHLMRMPSLWTRSTFYSTAGNVSADIIEQYIKRQSKI